MVLTRVWSWVDGADVGKEFHDQYIYRHGNGYALMDVVLFVYPFRMCVGWVHTATFTKEVVSIVVCLSSDYREQLIKRL